MPVKIEKVGKRYRVSTPNAVHAKHTTKKKAMAQARLLHAVDHGWKPTNEGRADLLIKRLNERAHDGDVEFTVVASPSGAANLAKVLLALKAMGAAGSSRGFEIKDYGKFYWDGDGSDKIASITMGGKPLEQTQSSAPDPDEDEPAREEPVGKEM